MTLPELMEEDDDIQLMVNSFLRQDVESDDALLSNPTEMPDEDDLFWDDQDWWLGGDTYTVSKSQTLGKKTFEQSTPGSSGAFAAAEAATLDRWYKQSNGKIPLDKMVNVKGFGYTRPDAAASLKAMVRAARKDGISLSGSSYRDYQTQVELKEQKPTLAATPGTSNHGWGMAIDISSLDYGTREYQWLMKHGKKYGWVNPEWAQAGGSKPEPWHWEYQPSGDEEFKPKVNSRNKTRRRVVKRQVQGRQIGSDDLDVATTPLSTKSSFSSAFLAMAEDDDFVDVPAAVKNKTGMDVTNKGSKLLKQVPSEFRDYFKAAARKSGLPIGLLIQTAAQETGGGDPGAIYNPDGANYAGAVGPMQVIPKWHPQYKNLYNARNNIIAGALILASYIDGLGIRKGLAAYNAGPSNLSAGLGYADEILERWRA